MSTATILETESGTGIDIERDAGGAVDIVVLFGFKAVDGDINIPAATAVEMAEAILKVAAPEKLK